MEQQYIIKDNEKGRYFNAKNFSPKIRDFIPFFGALGCATPMNKESSERLIDYILKYNKNLDLSLEEIDNELAIAMVKESNIINIFEEKLFNKYRVYLEGKYREEIFSLYEKMDKLKIKHDAKPISHMIVELITLGIANLEKENDSEFLFIKLFSENKEREDYEEIYSSLVEIGLKKRIEI